MFFTLPSLSNMKAVYHVLFQSLLSLAWLAVFVGVFFVIAGALEWAVEYAYGTSHGGWASNWVLGHIEWLVGISITIMVALHELLVHFMRKRHTMCPVEGAREHAILDALCKKTGRPKPHLLYIQDGVPNAFVTGIFGRRILALMEGIRELPDDELEAVMAHELSHLKHWDIRTRLVLMIAPMVLAFQAFMANLVFVLSFWLALATMIGSGFLWGVLVVIGILYFMSKSQDWGAGGILVLAGIMCGITLLFSWTGTTWGDVFFLFMALVILWFSRLAVNLILGWHSQTREFLADAGAAVMIGTGTPLISALRTIEKQVKHKMTLKEMFKDLPKIISKPMGFVMKLTGGGLFMFATDVASVIVQKLAPNHPSVKRREKALNLFD